MFLNLLARSVCLFILSLKRVVAKGRRTATPQPIKETRLKPFIYNYHLFANLR